MCHFFCTPLRVSGDQRRTEAEGAKEARDKNTPIYPQTKTLSGVSVQR